MSARHDQPPSVAWLSDAGSLSAPAGDEAVALVVAPTSPTPESAFDLRQHWEGTVLEVGGDGFSVQLKDLLNPSAPEEWAELYLDDVSAGDQELVEPGAVFYWSIGYEDTTRGREHKSVLRFRRLPGWSKQRLAGLKAEAEGLRAYFGDDSSAGVR